MSNSNASLTVDLSFPLGSENPALEFKVTCPFAASNSGYIDVPDTTTSATVYSVPFGTVASPTLVLLYNQTGQDMGVRLNAAMSNEYRLPTGGVALPIGCPAVAGGTPLTAVSVVTTGTQTGAGRVFYAVFGDPA